MSALEGIRVIEVADGVAGPGAGRLLAAAGAEVVKVEPPEGDVTRTWGPFPSNQPNPEKSGYFLFLNTGKKSVTIDWRQTEGWASLAKLLTTADVVIDGAGLSHPDVEAANPKVVHISITNFGLDGPAASNPASALTLFAAGGQMWLTGEPDGPPRMNHGHQAEFQGAFHAFAAATIVTFGARRDGRGEHVELSIQELQASTLEMYGPNAWNHALESMRLGNMLRATWGIYPCADGYIGIHALPRNVPSLLRAIDMDEWAEKYSDQDALLEDNDLIEATLYAWCAERTKQEIFANAVVKRAPFAYVPTIEELLNWPGLTEKGFFHYVEHPEAGTLPYAGAPFTMSASPFVLRRAPLLGEHNSELL